MRNPRKSMFFAHCQRENVEELGGSKNMKYLAIPEVIPVCYLYDWGAIQTRQF